MSPRASTTPAPSVDAELKTLLRKVKLGRCLDTLPERLALARTESLPHADFLTLLLSDEVERRDRSSTALRSRAAKLDPAMRIDTFNSDTGAVFDRELWNELCSLRFLDDARGALLLGPVGVGKTHCDAESRAFRMRVPPRWWLRSCAARLLASLGGQCVLWALALIAAACRIARLKAPSRLVARGCGHSSRGSGCVWACA